MLPLLIFRLEICIVSFSLSDLIHSSLELLYTLLCLGLSLLLKEPLTLLKLDHHQAVVLLNQLDLILELLVLPLHILESLVLLSSKLLLNSDDLILLVNVSHRCQ